MGELFCGKFEVIFPEEAFNFREELMLAGMEAFQIRFQIYVESIFGEQQP